MIRRKNCLLLLFLFAIALVSGCGGAQMEEPAAPEEQVSPESSYDKIFGALVSGSISEEQAVALSLQATFAPESLSDQYRGDTPPEAAVEINPELQWIFDSWETLDEEAREKFGPFILDPDQPGSFFNPENAGQSDGFLSKLAFVTPAYAAEGPWESVTFSPTGQEEMVRIYYAPPDAPAAEKDAMKNKALKVQEAFAKAWPMYKNLLMVEPTTPFKVWLINLEGGLDGGSIWHTAQNRCSVLLKKTLDDKKLQSTAVHELFHCFQYYMGSRFRLNNYDINWLMEATAKWSENYVYPDYNVEQEWLDVFFNSLDKERVCFNHKREYGSYMLFFFLSQYLGDDQAVPSILESAKNGKVREAVMDCLQNFPDVYAKFALYDWNQEPYRAYQDVPKFPDETPGGDAIEELFLTGPDVMDYTVPNIGPGGIKYVEHHFDSDDVKMVEFSFLTTSTDSKLKRQALIKIGETWTLEDWNGLTKREFCRRNPAEKVKEVVLVFSNADLTNSNTATYFLRTDGDCEVAAGGYTRIIEKLSVPGTKTLDMEFTSRDEIKYFDMDYIDGDAFILTKRSMNYSYNEFSKTVWPYAGTITATTAGAGSLTETYEANQDSPVRLVLEPDRSGGYIIVDPDRENTNWVTYNNTMTGADPYSEQGDALAALGQLPRYDLQSGEITPQGVKGKRVFQTSSEGGTATTTIEFEYILPQ